MGRLLAAVGFLTVLTPKRGYVPTLEETAKSAAAFPAVGFLMGCVLAGVYFAVGGALSPGVTAALLLVVHAAMSGALHLDGLSDTFDAIAKRGSKEEKLAVMKDPGAGAAGVAATVLTLILKFSLISALVGTPLFVHFIVLMPVYSRWAMTAALLHGKPAVSEGLGVILIKGTGVKEFAVSTVLMAAISSAFALFFIPGAGMHVFNLITSAVLYVFVLISLRFINRTIGGLTGDVFGAINETAEVLFLLTAALWSRPSF